MLTDGYSFVQTALAMTSIGEMVRGWHSVVIEGIMMTALRLVRCAAAAAAAGLLALFVACSTWDLDREGPGGAPG